MDVSPFILLVFLGGILAAVYLVVALQRRKR